MHAIGELAHHMGLLPLVWLGGLHAAGYRRNAAWWWLAWAFAMSWVADTAAHWINPDFTGNLYPLAQAAIIGVVLLDTDDALTFGMALCAAGIAALACTGGEGVDVFLSTVCSLAVAGFAWEHRILGTLRVALLLAFGLGWIAWLAFALWPGWTSWCAYQAVRLVGLASFCVACQGNRPRLVLVHGPWR